MWSDMFDRPSPVSDGAEGREVTEARRVDFLARSFAPSVLTQMDGLYNQLRLLTGIIVAGGFTVLVLLALVLAFG